MDRFDYFRQTNALRNLISAHELIENSTETLESARAKLEKLTEIERWVIAEEHWKNRVKTWLVAEKKYQLRDLRFDDAAYSAARHGWQEVRRYVPNLDGFSKFEDLPDALAFRYAAFAAAVLNLAPPTEVKSNKDHARASAEALCRAAHPAGKGL